MNYDLNLASNGIKPGVFLFKPSVYLCSGFSPDQYHLQREKQFWFRVAISHEATLGAGMLQVLICLCDGNLHLYTCISNTYIIHTQQSSVNLKSPMGKQPWESLSLFWPNFQCFLKLLVRLCGAVLDILEIFWLAYKSISDRKEMSVGFSHHQSRMTPRSTVGLCLNDESADKTCCV